LKTNNVVILCIISSLLGVTAESVYAIYMYAKLSKLLHPTVIVLFVLLLIFSIHC